MVISYQQHLKSEHWPPLGPVSPMTFIFHMFGALADHCNLPEPTPSSTESFNGFAKLPAEIQHRIWSFAIDAIGSRTMRLATEEIIIEIPDQEPLPDEEPASPLQQSFITCTSTTRIRADTLSLIRACRDARREFLRHYHPLVEPGFEPSLGHPLDYIRLSQDSIFVDKLWPWLDMVEEPSALFDVRCIEIHSNAWWSGWKASGPQRELLFGEQGLLRFRHLLMLHIIIRVNLNRFPVEGENEYSVCEDPEICKNQKLDRRHWTRSEISISIPKIKAKFDRMKKGDPTWQAPAVKFVAWSDK